MNNHPFYHSGELHLQRLSGVTEIADKIAKMMIVDHLPEQHQLFFKLLNSLYIASVDESEKPWASIITGAPGFIHTVNEKHLHIQAQPVAGDKLIENIANHKKIGLLGLEHHTRRRNRAAGELLKFNESGLHLKVNQAFGNCPKYIQARQAHIINARPSPSDNSKQIFKNMNYECQQLISQSDTFFIASYQPDKNHKGADISHRGGKPGFVQTPSNNTLIFDDFSGNNLYMTLGNLHNHPYAGLLFINYNNGDLWQIQCEASIIETPHKTHSRQISLNINQVIKLPQALNIKWQFLEYSKFL
jgi:uncharacterized protein